MKYACAVDNQGNVNVDLSHTCPVCKCGPIPRGPAYQLYHFDKRLHRWVCPGCWPKLKGSRLVASDEVGGSDEATN